MTNRYDEKERRIHCAFSEKCGGCDYAGMKYDNELAVKQKYIEELFGGYVKVDDIVGMYRPIYYRNKVHAVVGLDDSRNVIAGTYEENSHRIVDTSDCMIEDSQCTDIIKDIKELIASFKYQPYDEDAGKGMIRHILLRKGFSTKEIMLVIVTAGVAFPSKNNFLKVLCEKHPEITTIVQNINDRRTSMVLGKRNIVLKGKGYIEDVLCGCRFRISPTSFYQINHQQTEKLYKKAIQLADISKNDTVIDAYCGIGTIGIVASKKAGKVIGVELNSEAVSDAKINASINNIKNVTFVNADAGDFLVEYAKNAKADVVIMDPPRSGSTPEFLNSLLKIKPDRIVYISCGPDTQARDIKVLVKGGTVFTAEEAKEVANRLGYPVLVRPSYVLGGQGMQIASCDEEIEEFMAIINRIAQDHPILVDKYLQGKELEVDAVCDGTDILIPGIMEHIERTGVHSGDSISVYPAHTVSKHVKETIAEYTRRLAKALHVKGLINIQFIAVGEEVYVIEVNPRSSRTVPYISKVTGIPIVDLATEVIIGKTIKELGYEPGLQKEAEYIAIKMPVFSFEKIRGAEISLGPEMKSTGECLGIAKTFNEALYKAFLGAGIDLPKHKQMIITVKDADKGEAIEIGRRFEKLGYTIYATRSTAKALNDAGVKARKVNKINQESPTVMDLILGHKIDLVIDTPTQGRDKSRDGFLIRRTSIETGVNCLTAMDTAKALATSLENKNDNPLTLVNIAEI